MSTPAGDSRDLEGFGYRQELDRTLGRFSSFAAGFSYISILTGLFQTFYLGYGAGRAVFVFTWPVVLAGQFLVALVFAELAAQYPLSGQLPFSVALARVSPARRTPIAPSVVVGALAILVLAVNVNLPKLVELVMMVGVLWANLAYLLVSAALLWRRRRAWPPAGSPRGLFSLGRLGVPINVAAVAWSAFMIVNVGWPRAATYGPLWPHRFAPLLLTGALLLLGWAVRTTLDKPDRLLYFLTKQK